MKPGAKEPRALASGPNVRTKPFGLPLRRLEKVTRRKGGTLINHHRSNGYAPHQQAKPKQRFVPQIDTALPNLQSNLGAIALKPSDADMALIATLERGHRLTSPKGIAPQWD
jgi:hypothetical protein